MSVQIYFLHSLRHNDYKEDAHNCVEHKGHPIHSSLTSPHLLQPIEDSFANENKNVSSFSIKEIIEETKLDDYAVNKVLNNIDVVFDREEYNKSGIEKYTLSHLDQVPLLITMLVPSLDKYNDNIKDVD